MIGELRAIFEIAGLLERAKVPFKVADVRGFVVTQEDMGYGDFKFWLGREDRFSDRD